MQYCMFTRHASEPFLSIITHGNVENRTFYQMYQAFTHGVNVQAQYLKAPQLHPRVLAACNGMYTCPEQFPSFSEAIKQLPSLRSVSFAQVFIFLTLCMRSGK